MAGERRGQAARQGAADRRVDQTRPRDDDQGSEVRPQKVHEGKLQAEQNCQAIEEVSVRWEHFQTSKARLRQSQSAKKTSKSLLWMGPSVPRAAGGSIALVKGPHQ